MARETSEMTPRGSWEEEIWMSLTIASPLLDFPALGRNEISIHDSIEIIAQSSELYRLWK